MAQGRAGDGKHNWSSTTKYQTPNPLQYVHWRTHIQQHYSTYQIMITVLAHSFVVLVRNTRPVSFSDIQTGTVRHTRHTSSTITLSVRKKRRRRNGEGHFQFFISSEEKRLSREEEDIVTTNP